LVNIVGVHYHLTLIIFTAALCASLVVATEPVMIRVLRRASAIDVPCARSSHTVPTPRGGGVPIAVALILAAILLRSPTALAFAVAVAAFAVIGFADDLRGLPVTTRLALQAAASAVAAVLLAGRAGLSVGPSLVVATLVAVWVIGFVNVFNFMDGINGISAVHALVGGAAYACIGAWRHEPFLVGAGAAVAASALAFLPWNAVRARVFLGDVGSYGLGAALAMLAAIAVLDGLPLEAAAAPLALYLADTGWTLQRRIRAGERWLEAHRTHAYQRLCDVGWSHQRVTAVTAGITLALCALGAASLTGRLDLRIAADATALVVLSLYLRSPAILGRTYAKPEPA
jgi:UDP-GlcNAc:undecaprenyl-phosphate/decaprenyl-phosphate GlcNAc-1-phosphate transferase